jgi:hypothetical protein
MKSSIGPGGALARNAAASLNAGKARTLFIPSTPRSIAGVSATRRGLNITISAPDLVAIARKY